MKLTVKASRELVCEDIQKPLARDEYALFKVKACGVCGSDFPRILDGKSYFYPITLGHEFAGIVEDSTNEELVGKRAAVFPILPCGECEFCKREEYASCKGYNYYGSRCDGGMQDYLLVKEENLVLLSDTVSYEQGACVEPAAVCLHAVKKVGVTREDTVLIYGAGTIGLLCGMWAQSFGAGKVYVSDIDEHKLSFAESLGFERMPSEASPSVVIEASGAQAAINDAIARISPFGRIALVGHIGKDIMLAGENYIKILRKQILLVGSWNSSYKKNDNEWRESVDAIANGSILPEALITHRLALNEYDRLLELIGERKEFFQKIMLEMD